MARNIMVARAHLGQHKSTLSSFAAPALLVATALALIACGDDSAPPAGDDDAGTDGSVTNDAGPRMDAAPRDAAMDAEPVDSGRPPPEVDAGPAGEGVGFVVSELQLATEGHALSFAAAQLNPILADNVSTGDFVALAEILALDDPTGTNDDAIAVAVYEGADPDMDATNNFTGTAMLDIAGSSLDLMGRPNAYLTGTLTEHHLDATGASLVLNVTSFGRLEVRQVNFQVDLTTEGDEIVGLAGRPGGFMGMPPEPGKLRGSVPIPTLENITNATGLGMEDYPTLLRLIVGFFGRSGQPNSDLDDDGLERINVSDGQITSCTDGDGTEIAGTDCVMDTRMADGYTIEFEVRAVTAVLVPPP